MAEVMRVNGRLFVHTHGLRELSKALSGAPRLLQKDIGDSFKRSAEPVAQRARDIAWGFADTGAFASSIKITGGRSGVFLSSNDPAAGPIDFANLGAIAMSGPGAGKPIGVPDGAPSRSLFPAIDDTIDDLAVALTAQVEKTLWILDIDFRTVDA